VPAGLPAWGLLQRVMIDRGETCSVDNRFAALHMTHGNIEA
jgi:hypothetical protein